MNEPHDDEIEALLRRQFEGPVADDGFSERVMRHIPPRRRRTAWPLWLGGLAGAATCWLSLTDVPMLQMGWKDWLAGELSVPAMGMFLAMGTMSLLALGWSLAESGNR
ncbi:hypothetical protein [Dyella sp. GSA-30]|uniref:hypothetical protein n=1 Tax=Dyella sp. GSA-30 TaxID=2994496 RepID=UPI00248FA5F7|nr:hypothetical protein [Dyella sp. GSA-30]BDU19003.1 hypothetical protein DYGSA30_04600 [Dyella sp. GSA-30]